MKKVDLHIHSMYSDGTYTVNEIIERAKENQVELISICDHNCIEAYDELENKKLDVKILPGVEIDSVDDYIDFHILGYNFDIHDQQFKKFIEENNSRLELVNVKLLEKVIRDHPALSLQEYQNFSYDRKKGGWKPLHYFANKGICETIWDGFEIYARYHHSYAEANFPSIDEVCDQIHKANGKAILAHPGKTIPYHSLNEFKIYLERLLEHPFDGVECYYPSHSEKITNICLELCHKKKRMITCGSDCHGEFEKTKIGQLNISSDFLQLKDFI